MENPSARTITDLLINARDAAFGADHLRDQVDLLQNTEPKIRAEIVALTEAVNHCEQVKLDLADCRATVRALLEEGISSLTLARDLFKPMLGSQFGPKWMALGMPDSLYFPRSAVQIQPIVQSYQTFLQNNPSQELSQKQITADYFGLLFQRLAAARNEVSRQELNLDLSYADRDAKAEKLRKRLRDLKAELKMLLAPTDPRWKMFGFNPPGAKETPEAPEKVEVVIVNETTAMISFPPSSGATHYRVYQKIVGVDAEPVPVGSPVDPDFMIEDLKLSSEMEISVSAVNEAGEGSRSGATTIQTS